MGGQGDLFEFSGERVECLAYLACLVANLVQPPPGERQITERGPGAAQIVMMSPPDEQFLERRLEHRVQRQQYPLCRRPRIIDKRQSVSARGA